MRAAVIGLTTDDFDDVSLVNPVTEVVAAIMGSVSTHCLLSRLQAVVLMPTHASQVAALLRAGDSWAHIINMVKEPSFTAHVASLQPAETPVRVPQLTVTTMHVWPC